MNPQMIYSQIQEILKNQLSETTYNTWFGNNTQAVKILEQDGKHVLVLKTKTDLGQTLIANRFKDQIQSCFETLVYDDYTFQVILDDK